MLLLLYCAFQAHVRCIEALQMLFYIPLHQCFRKSPRRPACAWWMWRSWTSTLSARATETWRSTSVCSPSQWMTHAWTAHWPSAGTVNPVCPLSGPRDEGIKSASGRLQNRPLTGPRDEGVKSASGGLPSILGRSFHKYFCPNKMLVATKLYFCCDKHVFATNICCNKRNFVVAKVLSWQAYFCLNKHVFVVTKNVLWQLLSWQNCAWRQKFLHNKIFLSWQAYFCRNKTRVCHNKNICGSSQW